MNKLQDSIQFTSGKFIKNRFMLAPMTNTQSHEDGTLSEDEFDWLTLRAKGGFGITMTCASHVQENGKGFPGQLGIFNDIHIDGHKKLTNSIKNHNSLSVIQLHHAGVRSPKELIESGPVGPSAHLETSSRALTIKEVEQLRDDFISAAKRAQKSGYDGVEIHGAHGYILCQFLSSEYNLRNDKYGGSLENRARLIFEIVNGVREVCGSKFIIGVRLSPERYGMCIDEVKSVCQQLINEDKIDFLDISLWDCFKIPEGAEFKQQSLLDHFTSLEYKNVKLTVAGKISTSKDVKEIIASGVDFVTIGKAAILHHDFPKKVIENDLFTPISLPVTKNYLKGEGLGEAFIQYISRWEGFVSS